MRTFVIGGTGFIGYRLVRLLVARGSLVTSMDTNPGAHSFADLGEQVTSVRGDVTDFDEVMAAMAAAKPDRVVNLAYLIGDHAPHAALKLNILGMDNCFEAGRLLGVAHIVYAGSFAPNGKQSHYGDRAVTEDDPLHGEYQYAKHKIMNEWQALDYMEKYGMRITGIRCAYVTGPDKVRGTVDHVRCITEPARGHAVTLPFKDAMVCAIHIDDMAGILRHALMNPMSGAFNATAPNPVTNEQFTSELAKALSRPALFPVPGFVLKAMFGEMSEILLGGQRVLPRATEAAGYRLQFPVLSEALRNILK